MIPEISPQAVETGLAEGLALVLDVRQPEEHASGHIPGCTLIPLGELPERLGELPTDRPLHVVCRVGGRSAQATAFLRAHGLDAHNMTGGMLAWRGPVAT